MVWGVVEGQVPKLNPKAPLGTFSPCFPEAQHTRQCEVTFVDHGARAGVAPGILAQERLYLCPGQVKAQGSQCNLCKQRYPTGGFPSMSLPSTSLPGIAHLELVVAQGTVAVCVEELECFSDFLALLLAQISPLFARESRICGGMVSCLPHWRKPVSRHPPPCEPGRCVAAAIVVMGHLNLSFVHKLSELFYCRGLRKITPVFKL
jgi:hypothetical protein